ncbi:MAG: 50S ribosomal protein L4 [Candidatus Izemoplasmatales bacterium]|uniref:Large ribosomal subunit protein uL4 n=1 Tax=Hujiaoplasma nucleasis TaxID=2725268 RepID=A0A7L6N2H2_9MOLU|nr:50S ribosomal protein L4 [Hujiaoplasma nucleasis]QLY40363.1 50S ribosomal protein L4 [Hujiaoplasma nucleasis]
MPKLAMLNQLGESVKDVNLNDEVFGVEANNQVIYDVVKQQRAAMRQGTAMTKNRSAVRGGGRKPYRQKGTGHARQGTIRAPQYVGGGVVFGPSPRSYEYKVNKKVRRLAMKIALSEKLRENKIILVDQISLEENKTKEMVKVLENIKAEGKIMVVLGDVLDSVFIASRNIPNVEVDLYNHISVYDVLNSNQVVMTKDALDKIEEALS